MGSIEAYLDSVKNLGTDVSTAIGFAIGLARREATRRNYLMLAELVYTDPEAIELADGDGYRIAERRTLAYVMGKCGEPDNRNPAHVNSLRLVCVKSFLQHDEGETPLEDGWMAKEMFCVPIGNLKDIRSLVKDGRNYS